jgi:hypothetical protein
MSPLCSGSKNRPSKKTNMKQVGSRPDSGEFGFIWKTYGFRRFPLAPPESRVILSIQGFLDYFPYSEKMWVVWCDLHPVCVSVNPLLLTFNAWTNLHETWYVYHGTSVHLNCVLLKSLPSACVSVCLSRLSLLGNGSVKCIPPFVARRHLGKHVPVVTNTSNNRRIVGRGCLWLCLCIPLSLLGNNSAKTIPRQRRIVGGVVFYAVRVVWKESRRLVLPKTSCS